MATTPPAQIAATPATPPTPLHGPTYDHPQATRRLTRSAARLLPRYGAEAIPDHRSGAHVKRNSAPRLAHMPGETTPPRAARPALDSPEATPQRKTVRRVQVLSPPSPDHPSPSTSSKPSGPSGSRLHPYSSATTTMSEGMLPTPVKTPKKKKGTPKINGTARALFQENAQVETAAELDLNPRRGRKPNKRYNGFSLESFSVDDAGSHGKVQIFTDSRDRVPQEDASEANPFVDRHPNGHVSSTQQLAGTSKRRKITGPRSKDPQVEEAIKNDEGMVYVFRGKKVYRRFEDDDDEEEEIDPEDLGLLEHASNGEPVAAPLKTLTRKSVKPTRLFQSAEQKRQRELEKEEEAATDIEEGDSGPSQVKAEAEAESPTSGRALRSTAKPIVSDDSDLDHTEPGKSSKTATQSSKPIKGSPFDTWQRTKHAGRAAPISPKSRKRGASETVDDVAGGSASGIKADAKRVKS